MCSVGMLGRYYHPACFSGNGKFLTDRVASYRSQEAYCNGPSRRDAFLLMAIEHDGPGDALKKHPKRAAGSGAQI